MREERRKRNKIKPRLISLLFNVSNGVCKLNSRHFGLALSPSLALCARVIVLEYDHVLCMYCNVGQMVALYQVSFTVKQTCKGKIYLLRRGRQRPSEQENYALVIWRIQKNVYEMTWGRGGLCAWLRVCII